MFCENVGFEENHVTYAKYKEYKQKYRINNLVETENIIEKGRMVKDEQEIQNIKKACEITDNCFNYIKEYIKKGMTEKQIASEIESFFIQNGAEGLAFETIVASGENSSKPHAIPTNRKIQSGDIVIIDFGCKYNGYCSDMTRTIFIDKVEETAKVIYDLVNKNQSLILSQLREGANTRNLSKMVENDFKLHGYDLIHGLGHAVGLQIHEEPFISSNRMETILKENMVITNEPGIYLAGKFGIRIEDTVLITKNECITLTNSGKDYIVIED